MKKLFLLALISCYSIFFIPVKAQVLNVNNNEQLYNQWCWAGCSRAVLEYYGFGATQQCDIAEWVRITATFNNFGTTNCCVNANLGCNYWNYNYGAAGSIQDILIHFGGLQNYGIANSLTLSQITTEIQNNRLFVIRWGWSTGGGHFIVGHGRSGNNIYFMNPWFGEGLHIGTYNFMLSGIDNTSTATHTWTHTNLITSNVSTIKENNEPERISVYPNPVQSETTIQSNKLFHNATLTVYNAFGQQIRQITKISGQTITLKRNNLPPGIYFVQIEQDNTFFMKCKFVVAD